MRLILLELGPLSDYSIAQNLKNESIERFSFFCTTFGLVNKSFDSTVLDELVRR
jgi:hypothetical protein